MNQKAINKGINPAIIMFCIVIITTALTFILPSGEYKRQNKLVVPNSYTVIEKHISAKDLITQNLTDKTTRASSAISAKPVGIADMLQAIPDGIIKQSGLIFMVLFIGGMFGILNRSGVIELGLSRALALSRGNIYMMIPILMIIFSFGSTFMGLAKEYLLIIPMVIALTDKLGLSKVLGLAIVAVAVKVGYLASITNPYALSVAQPLLGLPVFSGLSLRIVTYIVMMIIGIAFVLYKAKNELKNTQISDLSFDGPRLSNQHKMLLFVLTLGIAFMVYASNQWHWKANVLSAYYLFLSIIFALIAKIAPSDAAEAFVSGMKKVMIAALLIGLATSVALILERGKILDTLIHYLVDFIGSSGAYLASYNMFLSQLLLDIAIPSTSGQAAVTMPIMGPVGQLSGISPQTTILAFLMGNGLTNIITPTSSGLLIFLATAEVSWSKWAKFIFPLVLILAVVAIALLSIAVYTNY
ncbi:MAG: Na+/H+ antiporter NhaC family protein [Helicobacter sp.]|nr:Na+/H+ antiporter NhaC family protein [Helicobacter sp.]